MINEEFQKLSSTGNVNMKKL